MHMRIHKLALVTGATSGIGEALCRLLAAKGIDLIITARSSSTLEVLKETLTKQHGVTIHVVSADLSLKEDRQRLVEQMHLLAPDLVINNAGYGLYGDALTYHTSEQMEILEVDAGAVLQISLEAARTMVSRGLKQGTILNVSSAAAFYIFPALSVYAASKAFVNSFSESFDQEMQPHGVRVLAICPGGVATRFVQRAGGEESRSKGWMQPMTPEFVAEAIWHQIQHPEPVKIISWKYRALTALFRLIPKKWLARLLHQQILQRIPPRNIIITEEV
jgi:uncharacterized protein